MCNIYYSTVKLRIPDDKLINALVEQLTHQVNQKEVSRNLSMKNLALMVWASARIRMPRDCELTGKLAQKATHQLEQCIQNSFLFDWKPQTQKDGGAGG